MLITNVWSCLSVIRAKAISLLQEFAGSVLTQLKHRGSIHGVLLGVVFLAGPLHAQPFKWFGALKDEFEDLI